MRKWFLLLLLLALGLFLNTTDHADGVRDSWIPTAILFVLTGVLILHSVRGTLRLRREEIARGTWGAGLFGSWQHHLLQVCAFFGVPIAINVALSAKNGELWGWSSFSVGAACGALATVGYYWPRLRGKAARS